MANDFSAQSFNNSNLVYYNSQPSFPGIFIEWERSGAQNVAFYKIQKSSNFEGTYTTIATVAFPANEGVDILQMEQDILLTLKNIHKVDPEDQRAFGSANLAVEIGKITGFLTGMQFLTWFVGIATLIAGVFAIGNILLITVKERTKEIGIRRAIGATPIEVRRQVVLESVFLTTVADRTK